MRWRVISLSLLHGHSARIIARLLLLSKSTIKSILRQFNIQGTVESGRPGRPSVTSLHEHKQFVILEAILENPRLALQEIVWEIQNATGAMYSLSTIWRTLQRFGLTRKRVSLPLLLYRRSSVGVLENILISDLS